MQYLCTVTEWLQLTTLLRFSALSVVSNVHIVTKLGKVRVKINVLGTSGKIAIFLKKNAQKMCKLATRGEAEVDNSSYVQNSTLGKS